MAVIHISEADALRDFASLLVRVRAGAEVVIEHEMHPVAVMRPLESRTIEACLSQLPTASSGAVIDETFAQDVQQAIDFHREPLAEPAWD